MSMMNGDWGIRFRDYGVRESRRSVEYMFQRTRRSARVVQPSVTCFQGDIGRVNISSLEDGEAAK